METLQIGFGVLLPAGEERVVVLLRRTVVDQFHGEELVVRSFGHAFRCGLDALCYLFSRVMQGKPGNGDQNDQKESDQNNVGKRAAPHLLEGIAHDGADRASALPVLTSDFERG